MEKLKRKSSVARKMTVILVILGLITGTMCFLNLMAYDVLEEYNVSLKETVQALQGASGTEATELSKDVDYILERIDIKISGTYIFDIILLGVSLLVTVVAIIISFKLIVTPTKKVGKTLEEIVKSIQRDEGDLTTRVVLKSNDEIGQLATDINEFMELLQDNMITMRQSADRLQKSINVVTEKVEVSNGSVTNVSSSTEEHAGCCGNHSGDCKWQLQCTESGNSYQHGCRQWCGSSKRFAEACGGYAQ